MRLFNKDKNPAVLPPPPQELRIFGRIEIEDKLRSLPDLVKSNVQETFIHLHGQDSERKSFINPENKEKLVDSFGKRINELCSLLNPDCSMSQAQLTFVTSTLLDWAGGALKENKYYIFTDYNLMISLATFINTCRS